MEVLDCGCIITEIEIAGIGTIESREYCEVCDFTLMHDIERD